MDKKIAKIGMIAVLTLALIISSLGVFNFGDTPAKEFKIGDTNELTAQAAPTPWDGTTKTAFTKGDGSANNPYQISNGAELAYLAQQVNADADFSKNKHYKLTADIDLGGKPWTPIGVDDYKPTFAGTFDGDARTISGVSITSDMSNQGLFGMTATTAVIKNLGVINTNIIVSNVGNNPIRTGGIVGWNKGLIINCFHNGSVEGIDEVGGIAGYNEGEIHNCYNHGAVNAKINNGGGLIGKMFLGRITNSYSTASVTGSYVGGVVGLSYDVRIFWSHFLKTGTINKDLNHTRSGQYENCQTFLDTDKGASILGTLNQQAAAYNATIPASEVQATKWIQTGNGYPTFAWDISIDETKITTPYNGQPQAFVVKPSAGVASEFTVKYKLNGSAETYTTSAPTKVGSYDVNVTRPADEKYEVFETEILNGLVIEKKALTVTPGATLTKVYDGNTAFTGEFVYGTNYTLNKVGTEDVTLTIDNAKNFNTKHTTATTVTINYTAVLTGVDKDNYTIAAGSFNNPATITAKPLTNIKTEKEFNGNADFSLTLSSANCDGFIANDVASITFATKTFDKGTYTGVGQITNIARTGADKDNYSFTEANITAAITSKKLPGITAMNPVTYNGGEQTPTVTIPGLTLTTDYALTWEFKATGETTFAPITGTPVFKNAGTYRVTATGKGNYDNSTTDANYEITQKEVVLSWTAPPTGLVYDGNAKIPGVTAGGLIAGEACNVTAGLTSDTMSNVNFGSFTFTATALSNPNYKLPVVANCVSGTYSITKATNAWINTTKPLSIESIKEGGTLNPIAKSLFGAAEFTYYNSNADGTIGAEIVAPAKPTAIGTYWVKAHVADDPNYSGIPDTGTEISFKISKKSDGGGGGGGGGFGPSITNEDFFWTGVIIDLKNKDDTVLKRECDYGTMPKNVLETIQDTNKTLDITMMGENLYITSEKIKDLIFDKDKYTIEEIKAMLADKPVITPTPTPDPVDPVPEKSANLLWLWILLGVIAVAIILEIINRKIKKRKAENYAINNEDNQEVNSNVDENVNINVNNENVDNNIDENVNVNVNNENVDSNVEENVDDKENVEYNDEDDDIK